MTDIEACRKQFEAWTMTFNIPLRLDRDDAGDYVFSDAWYGWKAWQAALASRAEFDAESPAGTVDEICDCGYVRGSFGCDDAHKNTQKVSTSPERVQIPAESKRVQCPKCPAHMPVGLYCGGAQCPLRPA